LPEISTSKSPCAKGPREGSPPELHNASLHKRFQFLELCPARGVQNGVMQTA
jgi:hypothetical protein